MRDEWKKLPRTGAEARAKGVGKYFTGLPCKHGHISPRRALNGNCIQCDAIRSVADTNAKKAAKRLEREEARQGAWRDQRTGRDCPPASHAQARDEGSDIYFTNKPCGRGHVAARYTASQRCVDCPSLYHTQMLGGNTEPVRKKGRQKTKALYWADPVVGRQKTTKRRARGTVGYRSHRLRTPPWQTEEGAADVEAFYDARPSDCEIHHEPPIDHRKRLIGGLHVRACLSYVKKAGGEHRRRDAAFKPSLAECAAFVKAGRAVWSQDIDAKGNVNWKLYQTQDAGTVRYLGVEPPEG